MSDGDCGFRVGNGATKHNNTTYQTTVRGSWGAKEFDMDGD